MKRALVVLLVTAGLLGLDRGLAQLAVHVNAAGALLSPSGAIGIEAALVALAFIAVRVAFVVSVAGGVAWLAWAALGRRPAPGRS